MGLLFVGMLFRGSGCAHYFDASQVIYHRSTQMYGAVVVDLGECKSSIYDRAEYGPRVRGSWGRVNMSCYRLMYC